MSGPLPGDRAYADKIDETFAPDAEQVLAKLATMDPQERYKIHVLPPEEPRNLAEALALFQAGYPVVTKASEGEIKGVDKNGNPFKYKYNYADLADLSEACLPLLGRCKLAWSCLPTWHDNRFWLDYALLFGPTGEERKGSWPLPDPDRTSAHAMGSAITYAKRYAFSAATGVAAKEDDDDAKEAVAAHKRREAREDDERREARQRPAQQPQQATEPRTGNAADAAAGKSVDETIAAQMQAAKRQGVNMPVDWFPGAWQAIMSTGPQDRPSPFGGTPWFEVFGRAFAASIENIPNLAAYRTFMGEIRKACDDDLNRSGTVFPWPHEGVYPADRVRAVKERLQEAADAAPVADVRAELEQLLAGAKTIELLEAALEQVYSAGRSEVITSTEEQGLIDFYKQREQSFQPKPSVPKGGTDEDPWATDAPATAHYADEPWSSARPVQDVQLPMDDTPEPEWLDFEGCRLAMRALDASEDELIAMGEDLGDAHQAGVLTAEQAAELYQWLQDRPRFPASPEDGERATSPERRDVLIWQAQTSVTDAELDDVRDANNQLRTAKLLTVPHSSKVAAAVSARRTELKRAAGQDVSA